MRVLQGVLPVLQTPFHNDDSIDRISLQREIDWAFQLGVDGVGTGMVSEILRLTWEERLELTSLVAEYAAGRGCLFSAIGAESTRQALQYARHAEKCGYDAVMAVPPLTTRLSSQSLGQYFRAIAEEVTIPVIVQDASGYAGQPIPLSLCAELLAEYGADKILFKPEGNPVGPNLSALRDATNGQARIFEGSGGIFLIDSFRRGIVGTMPGMDVPDAIVQIWKALQNQDEQTAYRIWYPVCGLIALQLQAGLDGFLAIEKHLLAQRGIFASERRRSPSSWELDPETRLEVDRLASQLQAALRSR